MKRKMLSLSLIVVSGLLLGPLVQAQTQPKPKTPDTPQEVHHKHATFAAEADSGIDSETANANLPACTDAGLSAEWYAYENKLLLQMIGEASSDPEVARQAELQYEHNHSLTAPVSVLAIRISNLKSILDSTGQNQ
jgi:hypothetical protein